MLLLVLALVDVGSSYSTEEWCYGSSPNLPLRYTPPVFKGPIYYSPRDGERKLVVSDGQSRDKRFLVYPGQIVMKDVTEQDDHAVLFFHNTDSVKLIIQECQDPQSSYYGSLFSWRVPYGAEYMEFSQMTSSGFALKPQVIWNRTDASASLGRGKVKRNYYEIYNLKQKDSGYYKFMGGGNNIISWKSLTVKEYDRYLELKEGDKLDMDFPVEFSTLHHILFTQQGSGYEETFEREYMNYRMELTDSYFTLLDLKYNDAGTYIFVDDEGFHTMRLELVLHNEQLPTWVYIVVLLIIVLCVIFCCCCVKKCCCKKSSNKRDSPETEGAAPPVYYHDSTQHTQPVIPLLSREPRAITTDPPMYNSAAGNMDPPPSTQVTVPGRFGPTSTPVMPTSSDSDPKFEFKGMVFPSAPPLSSDTSIQNVYTSNKLNFL